MTRYSPGMGVRGFPLTSALLLVIPLVFQQSLVIVVNFSFFSSLVTFSYVFFFQVHLFPVNMHDPPSLA